MIFIFRVKSRAGITSLLFTETLIRFEPARQMRVNNKSECLVIYDTYNHQIRTSYNMVAIRHVYSYTFNHIKLYNVPNR